MSKSALLIVTGLLAGCASTPESTQLDVNPAVYCRGLGLEESTDGFRNCVSNRIHQYCMSQGLNPGSPDYAECESNLRDATLLRRHLQIRGF